MSRMYIGVQADDEAAAAFALEFARSHGWTEIRTEKWLYVSGEAPPPLIKPWPPTPFAVRTTTADVVIYLDDLVTPWPARPGGVVPIGYRMDVWIVVAGWFQVNRDPELWTRADRAKLSVIQGIV